MTGQIFTPKLFDLSNIYKTKLYMPSPHEGVSEVECSKQCIVSALLQITGNHDHDDWCSSRPVAVTVVKVTVWLHITTFS